MPSIQWFPVLVAGLLLVGTVPAGVAAGTDGTVGTTVWTDAAQSTSQTTETASGPVNLTLLSGSPRGPLDSPAAIRTAADTGGLGDADRVAVGDPLVLAIEHEGLADALGEGNVTAPFLDRLDGPALNVTIDQTNPDLHRPRKHLRLSPPATRVLGDLANETTYVVLDTARANVSTGRDPGTADAGSLEEGDVFRANVTLAGNLSESDERVSADRDFAVHVREAPLTLDDEEFGRLYVEPAPNQSIRGRTNVRAGYDVTVLLRGHDDPDTTADESFVRRRTVAVKANGTATDEANTFQTTVDLGDLPDGTTATVDVRFRGASLLAENATLVATVPAATVQVRDHRRNASGQFDAVRVDATLSRGGFVLLHRGNETGPVAGVSPYLPAGEHENVTVYVGYPTDSTASLVAVAHRDRSHNHWFDGVAADPPYATDGGAVADTGFAPPGPTAQGVMPSPDDEGQAGQKAEGRTSPTGEDGRTGPTSSESGPGFGLITTLAAAAGLAVLARRR